MQTISPWMKPRKKEKKRNPFSNNNYSQVCLSFQRKKKNNNAKANPRIFNRQRQQRESFDVRMLVKIRGKRKSSETFSVVGEELKFFCANEPVPRSTGGRERLCTYPGKKPRKEFLWDKRLYGDGGGGLPRKRWLTNPNSWREGEAGWGWTGGRRGVGNWRDIPGKMIIRSWKNFWHEKKRKGGDRRNAEPPSLSRNVTVIGSFIARL